MVHLKLLPSFPKNSEQINLKTAKSSWKSQGCRWIVSTSILSITTSVAVHAAVITILLFDKPIPKQIDNLISVEVISSHLIDTIQTDVTEITPKSETDAKVVENEQSNYQEMRASHKASIETDKNLIVSSDLSTSISDRIVDQPTISRTFEVIENQVKDEESIAPSPPTSKLTPDLKPNTTGTSKNIEIIDKSSNLAKSAKKTNLSPGKIFENAPQTVTSRIVKTFHEKKEIKSSLIPISLKWVPTKKPSPPINSQNIQKNLKASYSFEPLKSPNDSINEGFFEQRATAPPILTKHSSTKTRNSIPAQYEDLTIPKTTMTKNSRIEQDLNAIKNVNLPDNAKKDDELPISKSRPKQKDNKEISNFERHVLALPSTLPKDRHLKEDETAPVTLDKGDLIASPKEGNPKPFYPLRAIRKKWEGRVILHVEVLQSGTIGVLKTIVSSGYWILDQAAIKAVRQWRFTPAKIAGIAVSSQVQVPVQFKLR